LVTIETLEIPFKQLPQKVLVKKQYDNDFFDFIATAIIGKEKNLDGYIIYLEYIHNTFSLRD